MNALALSRSKAKHPPAKVVAEARKIKTKVEKSNKNRRIEHMTDPRHLRLAEMDREIAAENATKESNVTDMKQRMDTLEEKFDADEQRLSAEREARIAGEIDQKATSLMSANPELDYSAATKMALANDERFTRTDAPTDDSEDLAAAVERRMKNDTEGYTND
jgi:DNA repair exonuclease SbcCD ATPase subunit